MKAIKITPSQTIDAPTMVLDPSNFYSKIIINNITSYSLSDSELINNIDFSILGDYWIIKEDDLPKDQYGYVHPEKYGINNVEYIRNQLGVLAIGSNGGETDPLYQFIILNNSNSMSNGYYYDFLQNQNITTNIPLGSFKILRLEIINVKKTTIIEPNGFIDKIYYGDIVLTIHFRSQEEANIYSHLSSSMTWNGRWYRYFNYPQGNYSKSGKFYRFGNNFAEVDSMDKEHLDNVFKNITKNKWGKIDLELDSSNLEENTFIFRKMSFPLSCVRYKDSSCNVLISPILKITISSIKRNIDTQDDNMTFGEEETKNNVYEISSPIFTDLHTTIDKIQNYKVIADSVLERYKNKGKVVGKITVKHSTYNDIEGNVVYNKNDNNYINVGDIIVPYILDKDGGEIPFRYKDDAHNIPMDFVVMSSELNYANGKAYIVLEFQEK